MKKQNDDTAESYRSPTAYEVEQIAKCAKKRDASVGRTCKAVSVVLVLVGVLMMGAIVADISTHALFTAIVGLLSFLLAYLLMQSKRIYTEEAEAFASGRFLVVDGIVAKMETNPDTPGCCNIWFVSNDKSVNEGWFRVRQEDVAIATAVKLVVGGKKHRVRRVFSDFMLTEEGIELHW